MPLQSVAFFFLIGITLILQRWLVLGVHSDRALGPMVALMQGHYLSEANQPINLIIKKINPIEKKLKGDIFEVATAIHEAVRNIILATSTNPDLTVEFKSLIALINASLSLGIKNTL
ncbi:MULTISPECIES: hypothetical protein [unclassified Tolypothrix]|uniref:hypothetical protein n=1 Tax=unclassified Tolypothrix TaxID=2649714 RepID=UPI0012D82960|nr:MULTISPECIES: hypothetical protein [unclassified Tolypothrix]MBE9087574.1 hypothetical protein [Tolypothrix sp. LEGE 11397]UYD29179.1 hypothetical protein HGR01_14740 [Tolypothrix sp. PCC 7712]UYD34908.1 hypothetical protein HG267_03595 [Tolypothrix sp. PCC 7601]